jgi:hypothetical protein
MNVGLIISFREPALFGHTVSLTLRACGQRCCRLMMYHDTDESLILQNQRAEMEYGIHKQQR